MRRLQSTYALKQCVSKMKKFALVLAVAVVSLPMLAQAAGKSASTTMQVTFTVKDSCTIQTAPGKQTAQPAVECQLSTPYQLQRASAQPAAQATTSSTSASGNAIQQQRPGTQDWVVYF
jgi:hypothetical protein